MQTIAEVTGNDQKDRAANCRISNKRIFPVAYPSCLVGVELEYEGVNYLDDHLTLAAELGQCAHSVSDGSLRNNGRELVIGPVRARNIPSILATTMETATAHGWRDSGRAGVHIHVNVLDMEVHKFHRMLEMYSLVEPALYRWIGEGRQNSIYCRPWYDTMNAHQIWAKYLEGFDRRLSPGNIQIPTRYLGCNLEAVRKHGTLEFRQMRSTLDWRRVCTWMNFLLKMKRHAVRGPVLNTDFITHATGAEVISNILGQENFALLDYEGLEADFQDKALPLFMCMSGRFSDANDRQAIKFDFSEPRFSAGVHKWRAAKGLPAPAIGSEFESLFRTRITSQSFDDVLGETLQTFTAMTSG